MSVALLAPVRRVPSHKLMSSNTSPDVFSYLDYRAFLRDFYRDRKERRGLSYRGFSRRAGLRSPNYLKLVVDGQRNLTAEMAARFAEACKLKGEAAAYFVRLVEFNQARTIDDRNRAYAKLASFRRYRRAQKLDLAHAAYCSAWYLPAIRELAARPDFREDPAWIASMLEPSISKVEVRRAIDTLLELKLLVRKRGRLVQGEAIVSTGPETRGLHIANYHRMMMARAAESIDGTPANERDLSALTLCVGEGGMKRLKERLQEFRRELLDLSALEAEPKRVVQLNLQLFPLSKGDPEGER